MKTACTRFARRQEWLGRPSEEVPLEDVPLDEPIHPGARRPEMSETFHQRPTQQSTLDELIKGMKDLTVSMAQLVSNQNVPQSRPRPNFVRNCIWCDSTEHERKDCAECAEALRRNVIFYRDRKIHSTQTGEMLQPNYGQGGMKRRIEDMGLRVNYVASSAGIRVEEGRGGSGYWSSMLKKAERMEVGKDVINDIKDGIQNLTGWDDPVETLTAVVQIADCQSHEALVEGKRRRSEEQAQKQHEKSEEDEGKKKKEKSKPGYKLQSDMEHLTDVSRVVDQYILDRTIEMPLKTFLGVAKKDLSDDLFDRMRRKRQPLEETGGSSKTGVLAHSIFANDYHEEDLPRSHYTRKHWARATTEVPVYIGDLSEPVMALIDHGSEVNLIAGEIYRKRCWPVTTNHGWRIRAATKGPEDLTGACPDVKVTIGDVSISQPFFVQENMAFPVILGEPYIVAARMETKVLDNGSSFAKIRILDGSKSIQFLTVRPNHERNRDSLSIGCKQDF